MKIRAAVEEDRLPSSLFKIAEDDLLEMAKSIVLCWVAEANAGGHLAPESRIFPAQ